MGTIKNLQRSRNKKGFTVVELIVVIGILGILALAIVPRMTNPQSTIDKHCNNARDFYYTAQGILTDMRLSSNPNIKITGGLSGGFDIIVEFEKSTGTIAVLPVPISPGTVVTPPVNPVTGDPDPGFEDYLQERMRSFMGSGDMNEWYYFRVDSQYRIVAAYMARVQLYDEVTPTLNGTFTGNNRITIGSVTNIVGAFPYDNGDAGRII